MSRQKRFSQIFRFAKIFEKIVCLQILQVVEYAETQKTILLWKKEKNHKKYFKKLIVFDYAETVLV